MQTPAADWAQLKCLAVTSARQKKGSKGHLSLGPAGTGLGAAHHGRSQALERVQMWNCAANRGAAVLPPHRDSSLRHSLIHYTNTTNLDEREARELQRAVPRAHERRAPAFPCSEHRGGAGKAARKAQISHLRQARSTESAALAAAPSEGAGASRAPSPGPRSRRLCAPAPAGPAPPKRAAARPGPRRRPRPPRPQ